MSSEIKDIECEALPQFKRNNYFYGKLLTAEDFENEQEYFVKKHRLINRLIHGVGILCGLKVIRKGPEAMDLLDSQIRITRGIALDACGREIVVPNPVDIDLCDKIKRKKGHLELYVWITYDRYGIQKIPISFSESNSKEHFNKIKEFYKIQVGPYQPTIQETRKRNSQRKNDNQKTTDIIKNCEESPQNEIIILAKVTIQCNDDQNIIKNIDNLIDERIIYTNVELYNMINILKRRIEELENTIEQSKTNQTKQ